MPMLSVVDLCREPELAAFHVKIPRHDRVIQHRARRLAGAAVGPRPYPGHHGADAGQRGEPPPALNTAAGAAPRRAAAAVGRAGRGQIRPPLFPRGGAHDGAPLVGHVALPEVVGPAAVPHGAADGGHVPQLRGRQPGENAVDGQLREVEQRGVPRGLGALHLGHRALPLEGRHERHGVRGRARGRGRGRDPAEQPVAGQEAEQREREFLAEGGEEESHVTGAWLGEEEEAGEDEGGDEGKHRSIRDKKHSDDG